MQESDFPERRRVQRVRLPNPLRATLDGATKVFIADVSLRGLRVMHQEPLAQPNASCVIVSEWDGTRFELHCRIVHTLRQGQKLYHSGLSISRASAAAKATLRSLIEHHVERALEEQKANARGIPPLAAYMYQPEKGELLRRCELIDGQWRKSETIRRQQPPNGFTISAEVAPDHVELLCETWERTTAEGRRLTQLLAELSISTAEGIPTRRYVP